MILVGVSARIYNPLADFSMDNLIMRKLYSVNAKDDPLFEQKQALEKEFIQYGEFYDYIGKFTSFYYSGFR